MNRLQLATILSWADEQGIQGRKRLQKVVFFLQQAGCNLDCQYTLHFFGPYSREVADCCDEMVAAGLIDEKVDSPYGNKQYGYALKTSTRDLLEKTTDQQLMRFQSLGMELIKEDIWRLELGSTILFYFNHSRDWDAALANACEFKKVVSTESTSQQALALAQRVAMHSTIN